MASEVTWHNLQISKIQHGGRSLSWKLLNCHISAILNFKIFNIWSRDCHCDPNLLLYTKFHQNRFTLRPPDPHNCFMFNARLLGNSPYHGNRIMRDMSGTWWDATTQVLSRSVHYSVSNILQYGGRPILNWNFVILDHPRSQPCGLITLSKFCVNPIFAVGDIVILWFCQFA